MQAFTNSEEARQLKAERFKRDKEVERVEKEIETVLKQKSYIMEHGS